MSEEQSATGSDSPGTPPGDDAFRGCHPARIDEWGRVLVPEVWRGPIGDTSAELLVFCVPDGAIRVLAPAAQEALEDRLEAMPLDDGKARATLQRIFATATVATCDESWRLTLEERHRRQAQIETDVVLEGCGDFFEVRRAD